MHGCGCICPTELYAFVAGWFVMDWVRVWWRSRGR